MRLIDADILLGYVNKYDTGGSIGIALRAMLELSPTATIERDIPKAPTDQQLEEDAYGAWGSLYGDCPNCKGTVYDEQNYCEKCGQRLDWVTEHGILETTRNYSKRENGDPNGFNEETVQALKDTTERKNLSKVYETLDDMYADMGVSEWREYIYRERETADGVDSDRMGELIRCRECKWWNTTDGMVKGIDGRQWNECPNLGVPTDEWFFCRDAERKEDA